MGSDKVVRLVFMDIRCMLYGELMAIYLDTDILTSNCMLLLILAASSLMHNF